MNYELKRDFRPLSNINRYLPHLYVVLIHRLPCGVFLLVMPIFVTTYLL